MKLAYRTADHALRIRAWRAGCAGDPALGLLLPSGRRSRQWRALARAQPVDDDRQVALPHLGGAAGVAELDPGQELEQEPDIQVGDVVPDTPGAAGPLEQL